MPSVRVVPSLVGSLLLLLSLSVGTIGEAQEAARVRLSGYVRSGASREVVRYALVVPTRRPAARATRTGSTSCCSTGAHRVRVRALGFAPLDTMITLDASRVLDLI